MGSGFWSCKGRVTYNGVDVGLYVGVAIVRPRGGLLGFVESWRGDHTVGLSRGVTVFRARCGLLRFMEGERFEYAVGLLGGSRKGSECAVSVRSLKKLLLEKAV